MNDESRSALLPSSFLLPPSSFHIVHLTSVHPPLDNRIFFKECRSLAEAGYNVTLVAPHEQTELIDGVRIRGVPLNRFRWSRVTKTMIAVYAAAVDENADVYHLHDPELIGVGMLLKLRGKRVVYDVHEDLPRQVRSKDWIPRCLRPIVAGCASLAEAAFGRVANGIVAATPTIARRFPTKKTCTVRNFPRVSHNRPVQFRPYNQCEPLVIHASAEISTARGAVEMVRAIGLVSEHLNARLMLIGHVHDPALQTKISSMPEWSRVDWLGWKPAREVPTLLHQARIGLNLLHDFPNYRDALPTKMYEYMSAGIPIIASDFPQWRELYEDIGCTLFVDPNNVQEIADAIQWLLRHPTEAEALGRRGRRAVETTLNWKSEEQKLLRMYRQLIAAPQKDVA